MRRMLITTVVCIGFIGVCSQNRVQAQSGLEITAKVVGTKYVVHMESEVVKL